MKALKYLYDLRDDYRDFCVKQKTIYKNKDLDEAITELEQLGKLNRKEWYQKGYNQALKDIKEKDS